MKSLVNLIYPMLFLFNISFGKSDPKLMLFNAKDSAPLTKEITITFTVPEKDFIYKDFIMCSIDEPLITLSTWKTDKETVNHYDPSFKETKQVFNETFSITLIATLQQWIPEPIHLYCSYYRKTNKKINDALFTFSFPEPLKTNINLEGTVEPASPTHSNTPAYRQPHYSLLEQYYKKISIFIHNAIALFLYHRKTYFSWVLILMSMLLLLFYFFQENIQKHKKLYELLEMIISLLAFIIISAGIWYIYRQNHRLNLLASSGIATVFSIIAGIFCLKKSTYISLGFIRTFYTFFGMICIIVMVLLTFKTIQYIDHHMNLL